MGHAEEDLYELLQLSPKADSEVLEAAYRRLARRYHPDRAPGPDAEERMRAINHAFAVLSDPLRRLAYDQTRRRPVDVDDPRATARTGPLGPLPPRPAPPPAAPPRARLAAGDAPPARPTPPRPAPGPVRDGLATRRTGPAPGADGEEGDPALAAALAVLAPAAFGALGEALALEEGYALQAGALRSEEVLAYVARQERPPHETILFAVARRPLLLDDPLVPELERLRRREGCARAVVLALAGAPAALRRRYAQRGVALVGGAAATRLVRGALLRGHFALPRPGVGEPAAPAAGAPRGVAVILDAIPERVRGAAWRVLAGAGLGGDRGDILPARLPWGVVFPRGRTPARVAAALQELGCAARVVTPRAAAGVAWSSDEHERLERVGWLARAADPAAGRTRCWCHRCGWAWRPDQWPARHCPHCGTAAWERHAVVRCWCCGDEAVLPAPWAGTPEAPRCACCDAPSPGSRDPLLVSRRVTVGEPSGRAGLRGLFSRTAP